MKEFILILKSLTTTSLQDISKKLHLDVDDDFIKDKIYLTNRIEAWFKSKKRWHDRAIWKIMIPFVVGGFFFILKMNTDIENSDLKLQNERLESKVAEILTNEYGGNSYAVVVPSHQFQNGLNYTDKQFTLEILNIGDKALQNVNVEVEDITALKICDKNIDSKNPNHLRLINDCYQKSIYNYDLGALHKTGIKKLESDSLKSVDIILRGYTGEKFHTVNLSDNQKNLALKITINSNNGTLVQYMDILSLEEGRRSFRCIRVTATNPDRGELYFFKPSFYPAKAYSKFLNKESWNAIDPYVNYLKLSHN